MELRSTRHSHSLDTGAIPGSSSGLGNGVITIAAGAAVQAGDGTRQVRDLSRDRLSTTAGSIIINRPDASTLSASIDGAGTLAVQGGGTLNM